MLLNYLKIAYRTLRRRPTYAAINVGGLTVGLTCCFLIVLFIQHEQSFDRFHPQGDRVFRVTYEDGEAWYANSASGFAPALEAAFPGIERAVRVETNRRPYLRVGGRYQPTEAFALADADFFQVFDGFTLLRGDPATVLQEPRSLVVTASAARRLFGEQNPIGQTVGYGDRFDLTVTGVMADVPDASHLQFEYLAPFVLVAEFMGEGALRDFTNYNYFTYALLKPGAQPEALEAKASTLIRERFGDRAGDAYRLTLQALTDIHFTTTLRYDVGTNRSEQYLYIFGAVGLFILLIACVNFMNLATVQSTERAREIGVRKALGARRQQLVGQFLSEAVLLSAVSVVLAAGLAALLLPTFNSFVGSEASFASVFGATGLLLVGIGLAAGVLAGSYPAFHLSAYASARVLRGELTRSTRVTRLRRGLVVTQFALAVLLIVATLTAFQQLRFMQAKNLGFEGEQVVYLDAPASLLRTTYDAFRQEATSSPYVTSVAQAQGLPGRTLTNRGYNWPGQGEGTQQGDSFWTIAAGPGYLETLGIDLLAGRDFSRTAPRDTQDAYILNKTAAARLGWTPQEAVGQPFRAWDRPMGTIIGVVDDFHFQSLHQPIEPVVLNWKPGWTWLVAARLTADNVPAALDHLRAQWEQFAPGYTFDYTFLDADFERLYRAERKMGQLFGFFAGLAVLVACFGLFGLAAFTAERRTKEIGVRKAVGASAAQIVALLSKDFVRLVVVAFVIAAPVAYVVMNRWLADFAYRIDLGVGLFALAGSLALGVALLTVSYHALQAARTDPATALRSE
jgi:putative ABC transport system permease protein